jgi:hypothetical protein
VSSLAGAALGWWLEAAFRVVAVEQRVRRVVGLARFAVGEPGLQVEKPDVLRTPRQLVFLPPKPTTDRQ